MPRMNDKCRVCGSAIPPGPAYTRYVCQGCLSRPESLERSFNLPVSARGPVLIELLSSLRQIPISPALEKELARILDREELSVARIEPFFRALVSQKVGGWQAAGSKPQEIGEDAFFCALLRHHHCRDPVLEIFLTDLRRRLLLEAHDKPDSAWSGRELLLSIVVQNFRNEFVHYDAPDERQIVEAIESRLFGDLDEFSGGEANGCALLLQWLMYRSPIELDEARRSAALKIAAEFGPLRAFLDEVLESSAKEDELTHSFSREACTDDATSARVADMYEENPFPRWTGKVRNHNPAKRDFAAYTGFSSSPNWQDDPDGRYDRMLVAGCGTGHHPLSVAVNFPWMHVRAVDLSCRSLAYAQKMADMQGIRNVSFQYADLLDLPDWGEQFDIVDAVGVLHHLENPEAGLRALLEHLRPRGLLRLGLYSSSARALIRRYREKTEIDHALVDADYIRNARHEIISRNEQDEFRTFALRSNDFYSTSGCRDMLFHVQETTYTLPELRDILDRYGLTFLSMGQGARLDAELRTLNGFKIDPWSLESWHEAEQQLPWLFASMYELLLQRAS